MKAIRRFVNKIASRAWLAAVYLFLYIPLFFLIVFSFNSTRQDGAFTGFSLRWYAALLDDYVGRYQWWPGYVDIITRKGNTLYGHDSLNVTPTAFEPASDESFLIPGQASLVVFVRNRNGVVTHYVAHSPNGSVVVARKLGLPASEKQ